MSEEPGQYKPWLVQQVRKYTWPLVQGPAKFLDETWKKIQRDDPNNVYYQRRYRRVPTMDLCLIGDAVCKYEADQQFKRDKKVDRDICKILKKKHNACHYYHWHDAEKHCFEIDQELQLSERNFFIKYGDLGAYQNARECLMKQKHRMIWERRHGKVGTGMTYDDPNINVMNIGASEPPHTGDGPPIKWMGRDNRFGVRIRDGSDHISSG